MKAIDIKATRKVRVEVANMNGEVVYMTMDENEARNLVGAFTDAFGWDEQLNLDTYCGLGFTVEDLRV